MNNAGMDLVGLFAKEFGLCDLSSDENVVILTEPESRSSYVDAAYAAARIMDAEVAIFTVPAGSPSPEPTTHTGSGPGLQSVLNNRVIQDALKQADFVVDLTREGFIHAPVQEEILSADTRVLFICDAPDVLARNLPKAEDASRVSAGADLLRSGKKLTIQSPAGTNLVASLEDAHPGGQKGFVDKPGTWDHWPSTMAMCWPKASDGEIVLTPTDILLPFKQYVSGEVSLTVKDGAITDIEGKSDTARLLEQFFDDNDDPWARYLSHMGWGMMQTANWYSVALYSRSEIMGMEARAFPGNFLWSTGPHPFLERESYAHLDIAMRGCTVRIDDNSVVEDGKLL